MHVKSLRILCIPCMHKKSSKLLLIVTAPVLNSGRTDSPQDFDDLLLAIRENGGEDLLNGNRCEGEREEGRNKTQLILTRKLMEYSGQESE